MSSFTLSDGRQIKFAVQYIALNDDGTFEWTPAIAYGGLNFDAWHSEPVRISGTYDTTKRHLLFMTFMADTLTQEDCEEIKTLIRIT